MRTKKNHQSVVVSSYFMTFHMEYQVLFHCKSLATFKAFELSIYTVETTEKYSGQLEMKDEINSFCILNMIRHRRLFCHRFRANITDECFRRLTMTNCMCF